MQRDLLAVALVAALLVLGVAIPGAAAIFPVGSLGDAVDANPGDGSCDSTPLAGVVCTLRAAVQEANALVGPDTIELAGETYTLTLATLEELAAGGDLDVRTEIRIEGAGMGVTIVEQQADDRIFQVWDPGDLTLMGMTLQGGAPGIDIGDFGGAIRNQATLALDGVELTGNRGDIGGAVFNLGAMEAVACWIHGNTAVRHAGGIASASAAASGDAGTTLTLTDSTVGPNTAPGTPTELALSNANSATLNNVTVSPSNPFVAAIEVGSQDTALVHVTALGGLRSFSFDGSHSLTFSNSAIEWCDLTSSSLPGIVRNGVNASTDASCAFATAGGIEAPFDLAPLADNGGVAPTFLPQQGSPLIDVAAANAVCAANDQRGVSRPRDGDGAGGAQCDIGSVEVPEPEPGAASVVLAGALAALWRSHRSQEESRCRA